MVFNFYYCILKSTYTKMTLYEQLKGELITAMKAKDEVALNTVRGILSACTNELVATKRTPHDTLTDEEITAVIKRAVKQRKDSVEQYMKGNRADLAQVEVAEISLLEKYLPETMGRDDIARVVKAKIADLGGIVDKSKKGMLMGMVMNELKGVADGNDVKDVIDELLV